MRKRNYRERTTKKKLRAEKYIEAIENSPIAILDKLTI